MVLRDAIECTNLVHSSLVTEAVTVGEFLPESITLYLFTKFGSELQLYTATLSAFDCNTVSSLDSSESFPSTLQPYSLNAIRGFQTVESTDNPVKRPDRSNRINLLCSNGSEAY